MRNINQFGKIYETNEWGHGSGEGSLVTHTKGYVKFIQDFLKGKSIRKVTDCGCGDWQFSKLINWNDIYYNGYDVVPNLIDDNSKNYESGNVKFYLYDGIPNKLPTADLLICKDVLQHLSNEEVKEFITQFKKYKYCLITNCVNPSGKTLNVDIATGQFRYLDIRLEPFFTKASPVYYFQ